MEETWEMERKSGVKGGDVTNGIIKWHIKPRAKKVKEVKNTINVSLLDFDFRYLVFYHGCSLAKFVRFDTSFDQLVIVQTCW